MNKGGHKPGSSFDLVSWSQGEVRHNTWYSQGKENVAADAARKRMLYLVGLGVELETGLRAIGKATARKTYAFEMAQARRPGAQAARRRGESGAGRAGNRRDGRIFPFGRAEAEK